MDYFKKSLWGPDPKEQHRKIKSVLRKNGRNIDRQLHDLTVLQNKTKQLIKKSAKTGDFKSTRLYAKELYQINKQHDRIYTSRAQLNSISMKIEEAYQMKQIANQMATSTAIVSEVNSLVRIPQLQSTMVELEKELMKAGIISEMVDDTLETLSEDEEGIDEEVDAEVNKIIEEFTNEKFSKVNNIPEVELPLASAQEQEKQQEQQQPIAEDAIDEEADKMLNDMRERLKALQN
ncbi:hypothetical protein KAFR_0B01430 [Kazachstania africana CBS 2517]|uniref:Vacuolar protein-sorting-associated protein 24 n=1 Tax=Kazachstania africana (strain ATCC 22294 / BCRC 22015 / CBS 2517 / CECT 1963 / NBRC 1671 / NRRL Y-8276) TaxID=1071382 RepID=H2APZ2_KAZAF|nr:hypothetical protein KAFR_0B01430 [Kazachstania africana CBS 2517]CCF56442.1 hypothetical protein KAFR_0B01430 [Kazachstania africana CBS 2517]